jgi:hypothetical protein
MFCVPIFLPIKPAGLGLGSTNLAGLVALNATVPAKKRATFVGFASCPLDFHECAICVLRFLQI